MQTWNGQSRHLVGFTSRTLGRNDGRPPKCQEATPEGSTPLYQGRNNNKDITAVLGEPESEMACKTDPLTSPIGRTEISKRANRSSPSSASSYNNNEILQAT